jgi:DHA1 family tetracycline resistance protein-like MFS transporter
METILHQTKVRDFLPLYAVILLGFLGYALTITLFIPMLLDKNYMLLPADASTSMRAIFSGLLLAMYPLGQFFGSPVIGTFSDYYGRKRVLLVTLMICSLGFLGMALSIDYHNIGLLLLFSFLTGLCESNMAISQSVIADRSHDPIIKTKLIGYGYSACSLGYILGPLLGGNVLSYSAPFFIVASIVPLLVLWIYLNFDEQYSPSSTIKINLSQSLTSIKSIFYHKKLTKIYFINFSIFFAVQGLYRVIPLYVQDQWSPSLQTYSMLISFVSCMCFLANLIILQRLAKRYSTQHLLSGLLVSGGLFVLIVLIPSGFNWIWFTYGLAVIPTVMALPTCTTWLSQQVKSNEQGQVLGNNQALLVLGEASSAAIGGLIAAIMVPLPVVLLALILIVTGLFNLYGSNLSFNTGD